MGMDMKQFAADVCDSAQSGIWRQFLANMLEKGYSEDDVHDGFEKIYKEDGREYSR